MPCLLTCLILECRSLDSDFLLIILRDLLPRRPDLKVRLFGLR
jgi:hypothetical protein